MTSSTKSEPGNDDVIISTTSTELLPPALVEETLGLEDPPLPRKRIPSAKLREDGVQERPVLPNKDDAGGSRGGDDAFEVNRN